MSLIGNRSEAFFVEFYDEGAEPGYLVGFRNDLTVELVLSVNETHMISSNEDTTLMRWFETKEEAIKAMDRFIVSVAYRVMRSEAQKLGSFDNNDPLEFALRRPEISKKKILQESI